MTDLYCNQLSGVIQGWCMCKIITQFLTVAVQHIYMVSHILC